MGGRQSAYVARKPEIIANLIDVFAQSTEEDIEQGAAWYPNARDIMAQWSRMYDVDVRTVAAVTAAISPQLDWLRNLQTAEDVIARRPIRFGGALNSNVDKARRILRDSATDTLAYFAHGPKVANFARNLQGADNYVTVDGHATQAGLADATVAVRLPWTVYNIFADCYGTAAKYTGWKPASFQAIVWVTWKRLYPRTVKNALKRGQR